MADNNASDVTELSPDKLLKTFTSKSLVQFMVIAVAIHIVVIGVTSLGTFRTWAMGEEPEAPTEQVESTEGEQTPPAGDAETPVATEDPGGGSDATAGSGDQQADGQSQAQDGTVEPGEDNPYVENLRETADPSEIPDDPGLDISIEDTSF